MDITVNSWQIEEIYTGLSESFAVCVTEEMMQAFCLITGDTNPLHINADYAKLHSFDDRVVYGMLVASMLSTLAGVLLPGERSLIHRVETEFKKPVYIGDTLTVEGVVDTVDTRFNIISLKTSITNQDKIIVNKGKMRIGLLP